MDMHHLHKKHEHATDGREILNEPAFEQAFDSIQLFKKGDVGMLIVPPATEKFSFANAISTCYSRSDRVGGINVSKMWSCVYTWIRECCCRLEEGVVSASDAYFGYNQFAKNNNQAAVGVKEFKKLLVKKGYHAKRTSTANVSVGLAINE